nr:hypothetical protein [Nocardiopsis sp. CNR-923]
MAGSIELCGPFPSDDSGGLVEGTDGDVGWNNLDGPFDGAILVCEGEVVGLRPVLPFDGAGVDGGVVGVKVDLGEPAERKGMGERLAAAGDTGVPVLGESSFNLGDDLCGCLHAASPGMSVM